MKINKFIIKIAHLFGKMKGKEHIDDVSIRLPTNYRTTDFWKEEEWIVKDVKEQTYRELQKNDKLRERCNNVKSIYVTFSKGDSSRNQPECEHTKILMYSDGILYYPGHDNDAWERDSKLREILE